MFSQENPQLVSLPPFTSAKVKLGFSAMSSSTLAGLLISHPLMEGTSCETTGFISYHPLLLASAETFRTILDSRFHSVFDLYGFLSFLSY
jgi:hypothetical protein